MAAPTSAAQGGRGLAALARVDPWVAGAMALGAVLTVIIALHYRAAAADATGSLGQGFPLDDAWIHAQFALNASQGRLLQYEVGTPSSGSTSPLWSLLEGAALRLVGDPVAAGHGLGVVATVLMVAMAVLLGRRMGVTGPYLLAVPVLLAMRWQVAWGSVSGMEVSLVGCLLLAWLLVYLSERAGARGLPLWSGVLAGLLFWGRPEGLAAVGIMALDQLYLALSQREVLLGGRLRRAAAMLGAWAAVAAPLMAWNAWAGPGIFPQTLYTKSEVQTLGRGAWHFFQFLTDLSGAGILWHLFTGAAVYAALRTLVDRRRRFALAAPTLLLLSWLAGIALLRGSADYYSRYIIPCLPVLLVLGVDGLRRAAEALRFRGRTAVAAVGVILLAVEGWPSVAEMAGVYGRDVASVSGHVVTMGRWARRHLPADALLAMSDVGAMAYFTDNPVVDMRGLVSPYHGWDRRAEVDRQRRDGVSYAILFPEMNERVVLRGGYVPIHAITLENNVISATDNLVAYRTPWADGRRLEEVGPVFDFEAPSLEGWELSGSLGRALVSEELPGERFAIALGGGGALLSSVGPAGDGDRGRGLSPPFPVEGDIMTVRVGGGDDSSRLGVRLWVDGRIERTAVGERSDVLVQREWDLRPFRGVTARLEIRDEAAGRWGHILVDEIRQHRVLGGEAPVLQDFPAEGPQEPEASRRDARLP